MRRAGAKDHAQERRPRHELGGLMLAELEYRILKLISPLAKDRMTGGAYAGKSKVRVLLGGATMEECKGKVVIDFGCGEGNEAVDIAKAGAKKVIGIDIRESMLEKGRKHSADAGVRNCYFATSSPEPADVVVSLDSFEHFAEPGAMIELMYDLLKPGGLLATSFGPTWYHPLGGHFFSFPFPWCHLIFSEAALCRWRQDIKPDGIKKFSEVDGGLNRMTIRRFEKIVNASRFRVESIEAVPIRKLRPLHNRLTREFFTSIVRARFRKDP